MAFSILAAPTALGAVYAGRDLTYENIPSFCAWRGWLQDPSWLLPHVGGGSPMLGWHAMQTFYPPRWLLLLLPPAWAATWSAILHLACAAGSTAWLLRTFKVRAAPSAVVGVAFVLTGVTTDLLYKSTYALAALYPGMTWAAARRHARPATASTLHRAVLFLAPALSLLGGEPQSAMLCVALAALELVPAARGKAGRGAALTGACAVAGGLLLGVGAWVPVLTEMALTTRGARLGMEELTAWGFGPLEGLAALWPGSTSETFGNASLWQVVEGKEGGQFPWNMDPFMGSVLVGGMLAGIAERRAGSARAVMVLAMLLAMGNHAPLFEPAARMFPPLAMFRYPAKYLVPALLAGSVVAAAALSRLHVAATRRRVRAAMATLAACHVAGVTAVWAFTDALAGVLGQSPLAVAHVQDVVLVAGLQATGVSVAAVAGTVLIRQQASAAMVMLLLVELGTAWLHRAALAPPAAHAPSVVMEGFPGATRREPVRLCVDARAFSAPNFLSPAERAGHAVSLLARETQACADMSSAIPYPSPLQKRLELRVAEGLDAAHPGAFRALGCDVASVFRDLPAAVAEPLLPPADTVDFTGGERRLYRVRDAVPRAFVARHAALLDEDGVVAGIIRATSTEQLLGLVDDPRPASVSARVLPDGTGAILERHERPRADAAVLHLRGKGGAVVGIRSAYWLGWTADQAGKSLPVVRVAGVHVGAVVEDVAAGPVHLRYAPPRAGTAWAVALLGCTLGVAALGPRRRRVPRAVRPMAA